MRNGINNDGIDGLLVENLVGKTTDQRTAKSVHGNGIKIGVTLDGENASLNTSKKFLTEPRLVAFIPTI